MMQKNSSHSVHRFAILTSCCSVLLLTAGALVTSHDAGLAVPDWPLSYGSLTPPMVGGIFYEHGHRMVATLVGLLTIVLAFWLSRAESRSWVRCLGWAALGLVILQGIFGGITVKFFLPPWVSTVHATLAQLFFITVVSLAVFTSDWWQQDLEQFDDPGFPSLRAWALATTVCVIFQLILGAAFRHSALGIIPHVIGAFVVLFVGTWTTRTMRVRLPEVRSLRWCGLLFQSLVGMQILLGGAAYAVVRATGDAAQPTRIYVVVTVAHVVFGALVFASGAVMTLVAYRLLPQRSGLAGARAEKAEAS